MTGLVLPCAGIVLYGEAVGAGPPAVLLHAGGERRGVWSPVAKALGDAGCSSVAYDLRGHGDSAGASAERLDDLAGDVSQMIAATNTAPVLVGASLGGFAAMRALADRELERRTAGLVLVDVVPDPPLARTRAWLARNAGAPADGPIVDDILARGPELRGIVSRLQLPVLLIRGGRHSALHDDDVERFARLATHGMTASIPEAGHLVARDAPTSLARLIASLLVEPRARSRRIEHFLADAGAARTDHPGGTLLDHLRRTATTLEQWGTPDWVVDAGRVHAAYGTDGFPHAMPGASRDRLLDVTGHRAERLVHLYATADRAQSYPTFTGETPAVVDRRTRERTALDRETLRALAELTVANELDVFAHSPELLARHGTRTATVFRSWKPLVGARAGAALDAWMKHDPRFRSP